MKSLVSQCTFEEIPAFILLITTAFSTNTLS